MTRYFEATEIVDHDDDTIEIWDEVLYF